MSAAGLEPGAVASMNKGQELKLHTAQHNQVPHRMLRSRHDQLPDIRLQLYMQMVIRHS